MTLDAADWERVRTDDDGLWAGFSRFLFLWTRPCCLTVQCRGPPHLRVAGPKLSYIQSRSEDGYSSVLGSFKYRVVVSLFPPG